MTILFWDRENNPIEDTTEWAKKLEDISYRTVALDYDEDTDAMVSTIWEGLDKGCSVHPDADTALIFETAFLNRGHIEQRFLSHSEVEALEAHEVACQAYLKREARPQDGHRQMVIERDKEQNR